MYTSFARVYDALMANVDYESWAAHYRRLMERAAVPPKGKCVECACGTGSLTLPLRRAGLQMTGMDLSEEMLAEAMVKARNAGLMIPFVQQDMCALKVPRKVDCVLATCDGVNYLLTKEKVLAFFQAAFEALRPGGALIFDLSTPEKLRTALGDQTLFSDDDEISFIWRNAYDEKAATVRMNLSIFEKQADGRYERLEEAQTQRAHSRQEIRGWLKEAGFEKIEFFGCLRLTPPRPGDDRWHILARKPEEDEDDD